MLRDKPCEGSQEAINPMSDFSSHLFQVIFQNLADCTTALTMHHCFGVTPDELYKLVPGVLIPADTL